MAVLRQARAGTPRISIERVQRFRPTERVISPRRGDFVLTHGSQWTSWLIRAGQALRYYGDSRKYTYGNHAAIFSDDAGHIIEALGAGVVERQSPSTTRPTTTSSSSAWPISAAIRWSNSPGTAETISTAT
ncbi:MAG: hypothetical protein E6J76_00380 [Deltaproteobacteria bacterium]|nr:MAG: hypothetical protein E6J76_00380 [Deltaproteobacteria bacterium]